MLSKDVSALTRESDTLADCKAAAAGTRAEQRPWQRRRRKLAVESFKQPLTLHLGFSFFPFLFFFPTAICQSEWF